MRTWARWGWRAALWPAGRGRRSRERGPRRAACRSRRDASRDRAAAWASGSRCSPARASRSDWRRHGFPRLPGWKPRSPRNPAAPAIPPRRRDRGRSAKRDRETARRAAASGVRRHPCHANITTMTGAEAVVEMLRAHGVEVIFGLCGDTSLPLYDVLARQDSIRHVLTRDERHAAYMADGYARVTGKVGVCEGPSGGGATYLLPGLVEANESSIPVLGINTDVSVSSRGRFTLTELDQGALMKPLTKWNAVLDRAADIPRVFRAAFESMTAGRPGSAHIALPFDVQNGTVEDSDVWADPSLGSFPSRRTGPDPFMVELAAKLLRSAKQPVFICGGGVVISRAESELLELAGRLSAPVATSITGKGPIDEQHALAAGVVGSNGGTPETRAVVDAADLVVFVGCRAGSVTTERWRHPAPGKAKIIHLDVDPAVPGTNYRVDVPLIGDARLCLAALNEAQIGRAHV